MDYSPWGHKELDMTLWLHHFGHFLGWTQLMDEAVGIFNEAEAVVSTDREARKRLMGWPQHSLSRGQESP